MASTPTQGREPTISKTFLHDNTSVTTCEMTSDYLVIAKEFALYAFSFADKSLATLQKQGNVIWSLASTADDDSLLVTGGMKGELRLWDMRTKSVTRSLKGHTATVRSIQIVNDGTMLISGSRDETICIWDLSSESDVINPRLVLTGHTKTIRCLRVQDGLIVSGSYDWDARVFDVITGECLHVLKGHAGPLYKVDFDGTRIVTGSLDKDIRVWDPRSGFVFPCCLSQLRTNDPSRACLAVLSGHAGLVGHLHLQGDILISADNHGTVKEWSLTEGSGRTVAESEEGNAIISLAIDGETILFGNQNSVHLVHRESGVREVLMIGADIVWHVGFTPSNRPLAVYVKGEDTHLDIF